MTQFFRRIIYNSWYYRHPPWDSGTSPPELMEFLNNHNSGRALDLGCGTGTNVVTLAKQGWQVTGVDFAPRAISIARSKVNSARVIAELLVADVTHLKGITGPFDFILDLGCFHGLPVNEKSLYLDQMNRVCVSGGFWLLYGFIKSSNTGSAPGLVSEDITKILDQFELISRKDGVDRRDRPSVYFLLCKK